MIGRTLVKLYEYKNEDLLRTALIERKLTEISTELADLRAGLAAVVGLVEETLPPVDFRLKITADDVAPFSAGFYEREFNGGRPFRWTGDGALFEFRVSLNRNCDWTFEIYVVPAQGVALDSLKGFADYSEIPLQFSAEGDRIRGTVPRRLFSNLLVLSFYHPERIIPSQVNERNADNRTLCLAFYELELWPKLQPDVAPASRDQHSAASVKKKGKRE
jgi:hypothetical protein